MSFSIQKSLLFAERVNSILIDLEYPLNVISEGEKDNLEIKLANLLQLDMKE